MTCPKKYFIEVYGCLYDEDSNNSCDSKNYMNNITNIYFKS